ncbi:hypothetical protein MORTIMER_113 [Erwinia phage vB_EamM_Mortimer]|uniref:Uncharacterized protein n=1 Tax=Erwinia phage vB_EamM_Mortimer TaxID=2060129 RepID=A0A2H5BKM9_9CAUD|nr:hypothetical protein MORTIMER_113 [Erwinia phage vB_EamM_Mortimer]
MGSVNRGNIMNIYLVQRKSEPRYTPDSFIAVATSTEEVLMIHPSYFQGKNTPVKFDEAMAALWANELSDSPMDHQWVTDKNELEATYLGQAAMEFTDPTIIEMWYGYA